MRCPCVHFLVGLVYVLSGSIETGYAKEWYLSLARSDEVLSLALTARDERLVVVPRNTYEVTIAQSASCTLWVDDQCLPQLTRPSLHLESSPIATDVHDIVFNYPRALYTALFTPQTHPHETAVLRSLFEMLDAADSFELKLRNIGLSLFLTQTIGLDVKPERLRFRDAQFFVSLRYSLGPAHIVIGAGKNTVGLAKGALVAAVIIPFH